ncbi:hypothetical protein BDF14DRAFT_1782493 [Spinellus fusiger]|nr:hypothetical protein BDF14DRAFT_1782493 [Spinellus fusiger]
MSASLHNKPPPSRLPFHRSSTKEYKIRYKKKKRSFGGGWSFRCILLVAVGFFVLRQWIISTFYTPAHPDTQYPLLPQHLQLARSVSTTPPHESIPNIVHFVYGLADPQPTLTLMHYLAIKSAHDTLRPEKIILHYHHRPVGKYFERALPMLTLHQVPLITEIFSHRVTHPTLLADSLRLSLLVEQGGILLDLEMISLKSLDHLLHHECVMVQRDKEGTMGLSTSMIMATPKSRFLQRWYATYALLNTTDPVYHSHLLPGKLATYYKEEITLLNHTAYFQPLWDDIGLRGLYYEKVDTYEESLGIHSWASVAGPSLVHTLDEKTLFSVDTSFYCQLRQFLVDSRENVRPEACRVMDSTEMEDGLVGQWTLLLMSTQHDMPIGPVQDTSGHHLNGLFFTQSSGEIRYAVLPMPRVLSLQALTVSWWMKTQTTQQGAVLVLSTDHGKVQVTAHTMPHSSSSTLSLGVSTRTVQYPQAWETVENSEAVTGLYPINEKEEEEEEKKKDQYHHYCLVLDESGSTGPSLVLYMDGYVMTSQQQWSMPKTAGTLVRSVWLGASAPEISTEAPGTWEVTLGLEAQFEHVRVWKEARASDVVRAQLHQERKERLSLASLTPQP